MKKIIACIIFFYSLTAVSENSVRWVEIGEGTYELGFLYPYKIMLSVPYGVKNINEIKQGLTPVKVVLKWLPNNLKKEDVDKFFSSQLEDNFKDKENYRLSKTVIGFFLKKLPVPKKHDEWTFIYFPDEGMKLMIDDKKVHHLVGAELNRALLDSWLNKNPVLTSNLFNRLLKIQ